MMAAALLARVKNWEQSKYTTGSEKQTEAIYMIEYFTAAQMNRLEVNLSQQ